MLQRDRCVCFFWQGLCVFSALCRWVWNRSGTNGKTGIRASLYFRGTEVNSTVKRKIVSRNKPRLLKREPLQTVKTEAVSLVSTEKGPDRPEIDSLIRRSHYKPKESKKTHLLELSGIHKPQLEQRESYWLSLRRMSVCCYKLRQTLALSWSYYGFYLNAKCRQMRNANGQVGVVQQKHKDQSGASLVLCFQRKLVIFYSLFRIGVYKSSR